jgi:small subunit ribosomal protein S2
MSVTNDIIDAKVFLGHPKNQSNPKTRDFWLGIANGQVVINPEVIEEQLKTAKAAFTEAKNANKQILVICEKELYKEEIAVLADKAGVHYLNHKVPSGVLTNFDTLLSRIRSLKEIRSFVESESFKTLTKKEQQMKLRALRKIEKVYKGVVNLRKKPDLVIIVDGQYMHKFIDEVEKMHVNAIILASSNFDTWIDQPMVLCNTNSHSSLDYVLKYILS